MAATCPLCEREVQETAFSDHHLVPKSRGGARKEKVPICIDCHGAIHKFFDNRRLEVDLNTVEALLAEEKMSRFLSWLKKRPGTQRFRTKRSRNRKQGKYS